MTMIAATAALFLAFVFLLDQAFKPMPAQKRREMIFERWDRARDIRRTEILRRRNEEQREAVAKLIARESQIS